MGKYEEITKARTILELNEFATLKDIKNKYRELLKEWHPDLCKENEDIQKNSSPRRKDNHRYAGQRQSSWQAV